MAFRLIAYVDENIPSPRCSIRPAIDHGDRIEIIEDVNQLNVDMEYWMDEKTLHVINGWRRFVVSSNLFDPNLHIGARITKMMGTGKIYVKKN